MKEAMKKDINTANNSDNDHEANNIEILPILKRPNRHSGNYFSNNGCGCGKITLISAY